MALVARSASLAQDPAQAAPQEVRLRILWGSGPQVQEKWSGRITLSGGALVDLQPLGVEADEAAALRLDSGAIVVAPLTRRAYDGCDVTVRGAPGGSLRFDFQSDSGSPPRVVDVSLDEIAQGEVKRPLDELGSYLTASRAPGDRLRVRFGRDHLVFGPGEELRISTEPVLPAGMAKTPLAVDAELRPIRGGDVVWSQTQSLDLATTTSLAWNFSVPAEEGAYRLTFAVRRQVGFAERLVPWEKRTPAVTRSVDLVVVDPSKRLPRLTGPWSLVEEIDPVASDWRQRLPQWAQIDLLPALRTPRPLGNVPPTVRTDDGTVALPATPLGEPAWQAYVLAVRDVNQPHAVEIDLPRDVRQHLSISILEPDAAGRMMSFGRDEGAYSSDDHAAPGDEPHATTLEPFRVTFWPRTRSPVLLIANRGAETAVQYGKIRVLKGTETPTVEPAGATSRSSAAERIVASYVALPRLADGFGAAEELDPTTGLSVDTWATFLDSINRLAQQVEASGFNAAIVAVAADGASLAPVPGLGSSPRFDNGPLAGSGADPVRKDVLEVLLRVFDREGLRLIPAIQLAAPLPRLEPLRLMERPGVAGLGWVGVDGRSFGEVYGTDSARGPHYNLLHPVVQQSTIELVDELTRRYDDHPSLAGVALQLSGRGYGVLPGSAWGLDDATVARFATATKTRLPKTTPGVDRFPRRAEVLMGPELARWNEWRTGELTRFYARVATQLRKSDPDRLLVLTTEELLAGPAASERLRRAVAGSGAVADAIEETGVDLRTLDQDDGIVVLRPRRLGADESLAERALDLKLNAAADLDPPAGSRTPAAELEFRVSRRLRLPSFDVQSPYGADRTYLSLLHGSTAVGVESLRHAAAALAAHDLEMLVEGGDDPSTVHNDAATQLRRLVADLPPIGAEIRADRLQPVTMRVYRDAEITVVALVNESPWEASVELTLSADASTPWRSLGEAAAGVEGVAAGQVGIVPSGPGSWKLSLPAYGVAARRYESRSLQVGELTVHAPPAARELLAARLAAIDDRLHSLDIERAYPQLQNPDFELVGADGRMLGWQPRIGKLGQVEVDAEQHMAGSRSLRLRSEDPLGVAAQSHWFPIPATGQLVLRTQVRGQGVAKQTQLLGWVEHESGGVIQRRYAVLAVGPQIANAWTPCELSVDDLPLGAGGQMRIQFHLAGAGVAWVDGVELFDLRFPKAQRQDLAKRLLAARTALDEGQIVDCLRQLDGYSLRYLVEYVPPSGASAATLAAKPEEATDPPTDDAAGSGRFSDRLRGIVPRILR